MTEPFEPVQAQPAHINALTLEHLRRTATPGATIAVRVNGQPILSMGVGWSDLGHRLPIAADAAFYIYSVSKPLLASLVLQLAERDDIQLDAPASQWVPDQRLPQSATIRQLLNHTAGLPDYGALKPYNDDLRQSPGQPWTDEMFFKRTLAQGPLFEPGEGWSYSNIGYLALKVVIERVLRQPLHDVVSTQIVEQLELRRTAVARTLGDAATLTPGFSTTLSRDGELADISAFYHPGWVSHGVVISTAAEVATFIDALFQGRLFGRDLLGEMLSPVAVPFEHPLFRAPAYGLGLMIDAGAPERIVAAHGGGGPGYSIGAVHIDDGDRRRVTSVAMANGDAGDVGLRIAIEIARAVLSGMGRRSG